MGKCFCRISSGLTLSMSAATDWHSCSLEVPPFPSVHFEGNSNDVLTADELWKCWFWLSWWTWVIHSKPFVIPGSFILSKYVFGRTNAQIKEGKYEISTDPSINGFHFSNNKSINTQWFISFAVICIYPFVIFTHVCVPHLSGNSSCR